MATTAYIIRAFVASPSELSEERKRLEEVVKELNITMGSALGVRLELIKWETHAYPGVSSEPQAVIDAQLADEQGDIFIGILWAKFGTPTSDAGSGTEHEFRKAYLRYKKAPKLMRIMFYFKMAEVSPAQIDAEQLLSVQRFKAELGELGSLYWTYRTVDEFVDLARVHLTKQIQAWGRDWGAVKIPNRIPEDSAGSQMNHSNETAPELGFIDLLEVFEESLGEMQEVLTRMTSALDELTQKTKEKTDELNSGQALDMSSKLRHWKRVSNALAEDMQGFSDRTEKDIPVFGEVYRNATSAIAKAMAISGDFSAQKSAEIDAVVKPLRSWEKSLSDGRATVQSFRDTMKSTPRVTGALITARNRVVAVLSSLDTEYYRILQHTREMINGLEEIKVSEQLRNSSKAPGGS